MSSRCSAAARSRERTGGHDRVTVAFSVLGASQGTWPAFSSILRCQREQHRRRTTLTLDTTARTPRRTVTIGPAPPRWPRPFPRAGEFHNHYSLGAGGSSSSTPAPPPTVHVTPSSTTLDLDGGDPSAVPATS